MTKRLIGIDLDRDTLRLAVLTREQGRLSVLSLTENSLSGLADQVTRLDDELGGSYQLGDRLATCLSGQAAFVRELAFPFSDRRKIAAALHYELAAQLPVDLDDYAIVNQPPIRDGETTRVFAAAFNNNQLRDFLEPFESRDVPLQSLDLEPYAYIAGLQDLLADGVLVCCRAAGTSLALVEDGCVRDYRHLPLQSNAPVTETAQTIIREAQTLAHAQRAKTTGLQLMGPLATDELLDALGGLSGEVTLLSLELENQRIEASFLPAVALALRAEQGNKARAFNLRQGEFALKNEWSGLRKTLLTAACLAGLTLICAVATMSLRYLDKHQQVAQLEQQMATLYQEAFPGSTTMIDVPLQFKSAIRQLQDDVGIIPPHQATALQLLNTLSRSPETASVDLDELILERSEVRLSGSTTSFEQVNQMAEYFRTAEVFDKVEVTDSKMGLDGKQVNYRMRLMLSTGGGAS